MPVLILRYRDNISLSLLLQRPVTIFGPLSMALSLNFHCLDFFSSKALKLIEDIGLKHQDPISDRAFHAF
jgi:hypothetical protein